MFGQLCWRRGWWEFDLRLGVGRTVELSGWADWMATGQGGPSRLGANIYQLEEISRGGEGLSQINIRI